MILKNAKNILFKKQKHIHFILYSLILLSIGIGIQRLGVIGDIIIPYTKNEMAKLRLLTNKFEGETLYIDIQRALVSLIESNHKFDNIDSLDDSEALRFLAHIENTSKQSFDVFRPLSAAAFDTAKSTLHLELSSAISKQKLIGGTISLS